MRLLMPVLRILVFLMAVVCLWLPAFLLVQLVEMWWGGSIDDGVTTALLYVAFLVLWPRWARRVHRVQRQPWAAIGFRWQRSLLRDVVAGLALGLGALGLLAGIELALGWGRLNPVGSSLGLTIVEGAAVALAVAWAEELLFRGWLLYELERGYSPPVALLVNGVIFAIAHFIKPLADVLATLPQFLGLLLLGMALVWARRTPTPLSSEVSGPDSGGGQRPSLGLPMGFHGGLVWGYYLINVGQVMGLTGAVPDWVTGLNQNPLAGLLGVGVLAIAAGGFFLSSHRPSSVVKS